MKRFFLAGLSAVFFLACGNNKSDTNSGESGPGTTKVQNVNGNQPDTTNGITLNGKQPVDSTRKDSVPH